ncbi:amidohydrolase family protein [Gemmatimonadota bacterium]
MTRSERANRLYLLLSVLFFTFLFLVPALRAQTLVIRAEKIYTVSEGIVDNGMILIEDGKITRVGRGFEVPEGAQVLEAAAVTPGFVDMHTHVGVYSLPQVQENSDGNEMTDPITPQVRALDSYNFDDPAIAAGRAGGVTTVISRPGSGNIIGGTSVAVKLKDGSPEEVVLKEIADLKMAIEGNPIGAYGQRGQMPTTLMGVYYLAEKAFIEAQEYLEGWEKFEREQAENEDAMRPARDLGKEAIVMALKGEIPVHIHVATASEIMSAIRLADQFDLRLSICHGYYAHLLVDALQDRKDDLHFNIGPPMFFSYYDDPLTFKNNPAILANAGYKVSLQTDALGGPQQNLRHLAVLTVRYGMREEDALRAITLAPAEAMDLDHRIGSIEAGKDADLVLFDGNPLELLTSVKGVIIDGEVEYTGAETSRPDMDDPSSLPEGSLVIPSDLSGSTRIAIRGGRVLPMAGDPIEAGTVLIENGKIARVSSELSVPSGYTVIEADGFVVMPGLVSPRSYVGIGSNWRRQSHIDETSKPVVPAMKVRHAVEPHAPQFSHARELGVTTALVTPGDRNVIGGRAAVLKTAGIVVDEMVVKDEAVMVMGLGSSSKREGQAPSTRMGVAALARETLLKAQEYMKKVEANGEGEDDLKRDLDMEALLPVLKGETPVLIHAERRDDIYTALRIADEFGLRVILDGASDAYKLVDELRERDIPVIVENLFRGLGNIEDEGFDPGMTARLSEAGIRIAFRPRLNSGWFTPGSGSAGGDLLEIAAFAVRHGLDADVALRSVTIDAARIIGMEDQVGSLEEGKDADILILAGHPFRTHQVPEAVFVDGNLVYHRRPGARVELTGAGGGGR